MAHRATPKPGEIIGLIISVLPAATPLLANALLLYARASSQASLLLSTALLSTALLSAALLSTSLLGTALLSAALLSAALLSAALLSTALLRTALLSTARCVRHWTMTPTCPFARCVSSTQSPSYRTAFPLVSPSG